MAIEYSAWGEKEGLSRTTIDFHFSCLISAFNCFKILLNNWQLFQEIQITFL